MIGERLLAATTDTFGCRARSAVAAWRYIYAYDNVGGVLALQHSLDAPDASKTWKSTASGRTATSVASGRTRRAR